MENINEELAEWVTAEVRMYWNEYRRYIKGKGPKPESNPQVKAYWAAYDKAYRRRHAEDNRLLEETAGLFRKREQKTEVLEVLNATEAAKEFGVSPSTIINWIHDEVLDGTQPGGFHSPWAVRSKDVEELKEKGRKLEPLFYRHYPRTVAKAMRDGEKNEH